MKSSLAKRNSDITKRRASTAKVKASSSIRSQKLIGVGKYDSGLPDLSTNKKYMEGFGQINKQGNH